MKGRLALLGLCTVCLAFFALPLLPTDCYSGQVTLSVLNYQLAEEPVGKTIREEMAMFEKENPNIKIDPIPIRYDDVLTRYTTQARGGVPPDVVHLTSENVPTVADTKAILDLKPFVEKEGQQFLALYHQKALDDLMWRGVLYALPTDIIIHLMFYNVTMFQNAGLGPDKPARTWEDFLSFSKKLTDNKERWAFGMVGKGISSIQRLIPLMATNGVKVISDDGKKALFNTPEGREAFKWFVELATIHKVVPPGPANADYPASLASFTQERAAMFIGGSYVSGIIDETNPKLKGRFAVSPLPMKRQPAAFGRASGYAISKDSKQHEAAWKFVKFMTNTETGKHYFRGGQFIPGNKEAAQMPEITRDARFREFPLAIPHLVKFPISPKWSEVSKILIDMLQFALLEQKTPEAAMAEAEAKVNEVLAR